MKCLFLEFVCAYISFPNEFLVGNSNYKLVRSSRLHHLFCDLICLLVILSVVKLLVSISDNLEIKICTFTQNSFNNKEAMNRVDLYLS
jgi:hypothetical protein